MGLYIFRKCGRFTRKRWLILIFVILASQLFPDVAAEHKEFDVKEFSEKITILRNDHQAMDFNFQEGKELEIIYTVQVKDELPIDIWFINEDNYLLLSGGAQFLYFMDGTSQQVSYTKNVVTLTKHNNYKLVMTNYYSNQTVEVNVVGEIRAFEDGSEHSSSDFSSFLMYISIIIFIILIVVIIVLGFTIHRYKRAEGKELDKLLGKKAKKDKSKKNKNKVRGSAKNVKDKKGKKAKPEDVKKPTNAQGTHTDFCGYCGKPVNTPFCKHCGRKI